MDEFEDLEAELNLTPDSSNGINRPIDKGEGEKLLKLLKDDETIPGAELLNKQNIDRGGRQWMDSIVHILFGSVMLGIILFFVVAMISVLGNATGISMCFSAGALLFTIPFLWFGSLSVFGGAINLISPENVEKVLSRIWVHQKKNLVIVVHDVYDVESAVFYEPELISSVHLIRSDCVRILTERPSDNMGTKGGRKVCIWNQNESKLKRLILELKLFEYDENGEAEKAARKYSKKLGIPYEGETSESTLYSLVPQY
tara:strand:- start:4384 stop:5154 length:771 start_codon:yes stop_codon:yes gene_type:complete